MTPKEVRTKMKRTDVPQNEALVRRKDGVIGKVQLWRSGGRLLSVIWDNPPHASEVECYDVEDAGQRRA